MPGLPASGSVYSGTSTDALMAAILSAIPLPDFMSADNPGRIVAEANDGAPQVNDDVREGEVMFVIREILNCKPGKVRQMAEKFRSVSTVLEEMGQKPLRVLTDVTGEPFWTIVAEAQVEKIDDFFAMEQTLTANETLRKAMADYHDLVDRGRREIYRIES